MNKTILLSILACILLFGCIASAKDLPSLANKTKGNAAVAVPDGAANQSALPASQNKKDSVEVTAPSELNVTVVGAYSLPDENKSENSSCALPLGESFEKSFAAIGDNGYNYSETEVSNTQKYFANFTSGLYYDLNLAPVSFAGESGWYVTEVYPSQCVATKRYVLHEGESIDIGNNATATLKRIRIGVCPTCPSISLINVSNGKESFEREFVPMSGVTRFSLANANGEQSFGLAVSDVSLSQEETEFLACADDGGHVTLAKGTPINNSLEMQKATYAGYSINLVDLYWQDNVQHADIEIRNQNGELEGRLFNVKQYESYTWVSANGTKIIIHLFDPIVVGEEQKEPAHLANITSELTLREGQSVCGYKVHLNWTSLQGNSDLDALKSITLER